MTVDLVSAPIPANVAARPPIGYKLLTEANAEQCARVASIAPSESSGIEILQGALGPFDPATKSRGAQ